MRPKHYIAGAAVLFAVGFAGYVLKERNLKYRPYKSALFFALTENDFSQAFLRPGAEAELRAAVPLTGETERARVYQLIDWIRDQTEPTEQWTVDAERLLESRAGACEIHALAVAVLRAHDIRARWIAGVRSSIGFGYLEAHVDGSWEAFKLRDLETKTTSVSAWTLYQTREPDLSIRTFYPSPGERLTSWAGPMAVGLFPFENVERHPELEAVFTGTEGLDLEYGALDPYDYVYDWAHHADHPWLEKGEVWDRLWARRDKFRFHRRRALGRLIDAIDRALGVQSTAPRVASK
ncbi:MAG: transglutaminase-like domain-containing protein [Deltaproteobacteria bacterium]